MTVSVAMAVYNGEKYIEEQLNSILKQLRFYDEVIVSDDNPGGGTAEIVLRMAEKDSRIKYIEGPRQGVIRNFENAIGRTKGDIIFLSDQDDVWLPNKVISVTRKFKEENAVLVMHDAKIVDEDLNEIAPSFFEIRNASTSYFKNVWKNSYIGCCMAFSAELKNAILPFPMGLPMHDQYIGLIAGKVASANEKKGLEENCKVVLLDTPLILYRQHEKNLTSQESSFLDKLRWRTNILKNTLFKSV
ncbi:MAG: glycosyltransferase family 2 protein [Ruminococcaceae bacterium]|nr:glycosyltransferase family 2 protein [Oscillospiraceae bacterium]